MLEDGRMVSELGYVDIDKEHASKIDQITEQWHTLWEKCDEWYRAVSNPTMKRKEVIL